MSSLPVERRFRVEAEGTVLIEEFVRAWTYTCRACAEPSPSPAQTRGPLSVLSAKTGQQHIRRDWKSRVFMRATEAVVGSRQGLK